MIFKTFLRSFFLQALWNFQTMQGLGFLFVLKPHLLKLYKDKEEKKEAFLRHIKFFNTHPYFASVIIGIVMKKEEEYKKTGNKEILKEIENWKLNLAGPLAAIGDVAIWGSLRPFLALFVISLYFYFSNYSEFFYILPLFFLLSYNFFHISIRYFGLIRGYELKEEVFDYLEKLRIKNFSNFLKIFGIILNIILFLFLYFNPPLNVFSILNLLLFILFIFLSRKFSVEILFYIFVITGYIVGVLK